VIYKLTAIVMHNDFEPIVHEFFYSGDTKDEALDKIDTLPNHIYNLKHYGKTSFKSKDGARHEWMIELVNKSLN